MRSTSLNFPDTANFNNYIENQKAFERHKKQLDKIYSRLNYKSAVEFGITDNTSFKLLEEKTKQINYLHRFYAGERNQIIAKDNYIMSQKLQSIEKRKNIIKINDEQTKQLFSLIKSRSEMLKIIEEEKMKIDNENIGTRLEQKSHPTIKNKDILDSYNMNMNYKKFSNKFELPKIVDKVPKILGRKFDLEPYDRMKRNIPFDLYGAENTYYSPRIKNLSYNKSNHSSTKDSQFKEKDDFTRKSSEYGKSEINSQDY